MKIMSFNVNGVRARLHQIKTVVEQHHPDIVGLQEVKVVDDAFPRTFFDELGYNVETFGQKGHYGVAIMSLQKPTNVIRGFPNDKNTDQKRFISATFLDTKKNPFVIMNGYFPQGESREHPIKFPAKKKFYSDLLAYLKSDFNAKENILIMGDMNIAPEDIDIGIGDKNAKRWLKAGKCCFLPEERDWLNNLLNWGLVDLHRMLNPDSTKLSWFDYRSKGFDDEPKRGLRIDLLLATNQFSKRFLETGIDHKIRAMEKPSDHAPIWGVFE